MRRKHIHRRAFLRGIGTIGIGFPFLEEMLPSASAAAVRKARAGAARARAHRLAQEAKRLEADARREARNRGRAAVARYTLCVW